MQMKYVLYHTNEWMNGAVVFFLYSSGFIRRWMKIYRHWNARNKTKKKNYKSAVPIIHKCFLKKKREANSAQYAWLFGRRWRIITQHCLIATTRTIPVLIRSKKNNSFFFYNLFKFHISTRDFFYFVLNWWWTINFGCHSFWNKFFRKNYDACS